MLCSRWGRDRKVPGGTHRAGAGETADQDYKDNNRMLFGDAKKTLDEVLAALKV
ncbi:MAG: hypothetical protein Q8O34_07735 [Rhodocyclaceae bacterium]|nr:hypothetical protein [Rhodocyclaceae bacterium]